MMRFFIAIMTVALAWADDGLVDHPIAGSGAAVYLDGTFWTASATVKGPRPNSPCTFKADMDFNAGTTTGGSVAALTKEACCEACRRDESCAAAVLHDALCWLKTEADLAKPSTSKGRTACVLPAHEGSHSMSVPATVPGDLLTDLQKAGEIGDPLYENNFLNASLWNDNVWTYTTKFGVDAATLAGEATTLLVFDGIKMGATVVVNGKVVGKAEDQFRRYIFPLSAGSGERGEGPGENPLELRAEANTLTVSFDPATAVDGRFMACTGGWDWAPYTNTFSSGTNAHTFSKGIWKSVYTIAVPAGSAVMTHVTPHTHFLGDYPLAPMADGKHGGFAVNVTAHFWAPTGGATGALSASGSWGVDSAAAAATTLPAGESAASVTVAAPADKIKLWWPTGVGPNVQPLFNVTATWSPTGASGEDGSVSATRRIGFRVFAMVTGNDTAPGYVAANAKADGNDVHGMMFRVNGAAMYSRGANMIPMEELEGRMDALAHRILVRSAVEAGMNTLRVWGGGIFLPRAWYEACDELGVLVYHDMQFAQSGHSPVKTAEQDAEFRHQIRRLSHHPAIAVWDGCNECHVVIGTDTGIYATFVMTVVAEEDPSRVVWPSCPAPGWTAGVDRLYGNPNGSPLGLNPRFLAADAEDVPVGGGAFGTHETHGPYQHGGGFPAVNGLPKGGGFKSNIPISISETTVGIEQENVYASEFGCSVMSSFESMAPTLKQEHWGLHGGAAPDTCRGGFASECQGDNVMAQRNYPCDNIVQVFFGAKGATADLNATGEAAFKAQLFQCMVGQALNLKQNIETRRSRNEFGCLVWQFNEIWPTGGWGSVEYGTVGFTKGQVRGGRWKPLHYWYKASIYADVMATCGAGGSSDGTLLCYVRNDRAAAPFNGTVALDWYSLSGRGAKVGQHTEQVSLGPGPGAVHWFTLPDSADHADVALVSTVTEGGTGTMSRADSASSVVLSSHMIQLVTPGELKAKQATLTFSVADNANADGTIDIAVTSDEVAVFVTLTTMAQGRFSDNTFLLPATTRTIQFIPFGKDTAASDLATLKSTLRIEDHSAYAM